MAHKTLTISEEAYNILVSLKSSKESFTDLIIRLGKSLQKRPLLDFAGKLKDDRFERATLEIRERGLEYGRLERVKIR
jgi:predicted CopG family antitoxin